MADLNRILARFPTRHLTYCFAYGSGVFRQSGRNDRPMVDLMMVVNDTHDFHQENLSANPDHYSALRIAGPSVVSAVQTQCGANVYFNTNVTVDGLTFKYGVVDKTDFTQDLRSWRTLYLAGRLHKPVLLLRDSGLFSELVARNLKSAVHASLLQLPDEFSERQLYSRITGLSYSGDFRMIIGEDKNKVVNIVGPQVEEFRRLYAPILETLGNRLSVNSSVEQDKSVRTKLYHLQRLPQNLKDIVVLLASSNGKQCVDSDDALRELAKREDLGKIIHNGICRIVFYSSLTQSIKGIATAGLFKSVIYSYNKLNKMVKSMFL